MSQRISIFVAANLLMCRRVEAGEIECQIVSGSYIIYI